VLRTKVRYTVSHQACQRSWRIVLNTAQLKAISTIWQTLSLGRHIHNGT